MKPVVRPTHPGVLLALGTVLAGPPGVGAQDVEEILSYDVFVDVRPGGQMLVSEEITVRALGREIRRGIYRDFPTSFPRASGLGRIEAPFTVQQVLRDGRPEPYATLSIGGSVGRGGIRIRAGRESVFLDPGVYTYTFVYETDRWIRFGDDRDELYWNVTGNGWTLPIRSASARVRIEELTSAPELEAFTGPTGSSARNAEASWDSTTRTATFTTVGSLERSSGLTLRMSFPSGLLTPPSEEQQADWFALDWGGYIDVGYLVLLVVAVYLLMWRRVGVDPAPGPAPLRREPPEGFSPTALGYLEKRGYDMSQLVAVLVSMAIKGAVRIERSDGSWTLHKVDAQADLSREERRVFDALLGSSSKIELKQSNHAKLRKAIKGLKSTLSEQLEREYFVNNRGWFAAGLTVSLAGLATLIWRWRFGVEPQVWFLGLWLTFWTLGVVTIVTRIVQTAKGARHTPALWVGAGALTLFSLPFIGAEVVVAGILIGMAPTHLVLAVLAVATTNVLFYHLLERPTLKGRGVLNHVEGFRAYLAGRARSLESGEDHGMHFERFLPHAIALGLEDRWADGFGEALQPSAPDRGRPLVPWYHGDSPRIDASSFASSLGSGLASTLSASSSPPSGGGSGGGGGGSSGGGGGGGGGGGW